MGVDIRSLLAVSAVTELLFAIMLASAWSTRRFDRSLVYWSLGSVCAAMGSLGGCLRGEIPDWISIELTNAVTFGALGLRLAGLRSFAGQPVRLAWLLLPAILLGLTFHFRESLDLGLTRRVVMSGIVGIGYGVLMLRDLVLAQREEPLTMRRLVLVLIGLQTVNDIVRILVGAFGGFASNQYFQPSAAFAWLLLNVLCLYGVLNLACFLMLFERRERQLVRAANVDALTGLLNRAGFEQLAMRQLQRSRHDARPVSVLAMDLDHFKSINDQHGHEGGDVMLEAFARCARTTLRPTDLLSRPGGEEFWALLPDTDADDARGIAQRVCDQFRDLRVPFGDRHIVATVSIGVAEVDPLPGSLRAALSSADRRLYEAKHLGRDQVVVAGDPPGSLSAVPPICGSAKACRIDAHSGWRFIDSPPGFP